MAHLSGSDRSQLLLLPEAVDDYVGSDNPVRLIEAFVDSIDLVAAGFSRVTAKETGRPGYDPADLLKTLPLRIFESGTFEPKAGSRNPP
jgi:transposase